MLSEWAFAVVSGTIGSLLSAVIIFAVSEVRTRRARSETQAERWAKQVEIWSKRQMPGRQGITNQYTFAVLKYLLIGNALWVLPDLLTPLREIAGLPYGALAVVSMIALVCGLFFFLLGIGRIVAYARLRRTDPSDLLV
jgi:hypothetical protein